MERIVHLLAILSFVLTSCDKNRVFEQNTPIPKESWNFKNVIHYDVNIADTVRAHTVYLNIRNTGSYQYSNIYLFITTHAPNGSFVKDTFEIKLADERGRWLGNGTGNIFSRQVPFKQNIRFPFRGIYTFDIQHAMWNENLEGITDIGLRVEKVR